MVVRFRRRQTVTASAKPYPVLALTPPGERRQRSDHEALRPEGATRRLGHDEVCEWMLLFIETTYVSVTWSGCEKFTEAVRTLVQRKPQDLLRSQDGRSPSSQLTRYCRAIKSAAALGSYFARLDGDWIRIPPTGTGYAPGLFSFAKTNFSGQSAARHVYANVTTTRPSKPIQRSAGSTFSSLTPPGTHGERNVKLLCANRCDPSPPPDHCLIPFVPGEHRIATHHDSFDGYHRGHQDGSPYGRSP